jgi:hypothetical protein
MKALIAILFFLTGCTSLEAPCYNIALHKVKKDLASENHFKNKISRMDFFLEQSIRFMLANFSDGDRCSNLNLEVIYSGDDPLNKAKKSHSIDGETMEYSLIYKLKKGTQLLAKGKIKEFDSFLVAKQLYPSILSGEASQIATAEVLAQRLELSLKQDLKKLSKNNKISCRNKSLIVE